MAVTLKSKYGRQIPEQIAAMITAVYPAFLAKSFLRDALKGYDALELMPRGVHIAAALKTHLPADFPQAVNILLQSMSLQAKQTDSGGLASFLFLPHAMFVAQHGLGHFAESMQAQHAITQRFTAEFSMRPFLVQHQHATLEQLTLWASDPSHHVRRLVSECSRPRLPWAARLRPFQRDPQPVLALLELLKDDPSLYVRRSVANNLNDIGKDHLQLLVDVAARWMKNATAEREWIVRHALRSAIKRGDRGALAVLGFAAKTTLTIGYENLSPLSSITPRRAKIGGSVVITFDLTNHAKRQADAIVDFAVHFVKANGRANAKVFKLKTIRLGAGQTQRLSKKISLAEMTTRQLYAGKHQIDIIINGVVTPLGAFVLN